MAEILRNGYEGRVREPPLQPLTRGETLAGRRGPTGHMPQPNGASNMPNITRNLGRALCLALACLPAIVAGSAVAQTVKTEVHTVRASVVVSGLVQPWGMAWLPDGRLLITEKRGTLRMVRGGRLLPEPLAGLPKSTEHGQGGLLDVAVHPDHAKNGWIYWSYNGEQDGQHGTEVARGKLSADGTQLTDVQVVFRMRPKSSGGQHFGSRLVFGRDGYLYITLGDRGDSPSKGREHRAQRLDDHAGSVIRLHDDGRVPADNPYVGRAGALPEIYNHGHRNIQGMTYDPVTKRIWATEHGSKGGDEVNLIDGAQAALVGPQDKAQRPAGHRQIPLGQVVLEPTREGGFG